MKFRGPLDEPPVSEADIQAYSDGTLAGARAAHVRRYLAGTPGEWHRILFYRRLNAQIRDAYPAPRRRRRRPTRAPPQPEADGRCATLSRSLPRWRWQAPHWRGSA